MKKLVIAIALSLMMATGTTHAGMKHDHKNMSNGKVDEAMTMIKINNIDKKNRTLNVDHDKIAAFGWSAMTMDLPVSKKVDLDALKEGQGVMATIKKGRDKKFRIIKIGH